MSDISMDELLKLGSDPSIGENALSLISMLKETNQVLSEARKTMNLLDSLGIKTLLVRGLAEKYHIDIDTPLKEDQSVIPKSDLHKMTFKQLNKLPEKELAELLQILQKGEKQG